MLLVHNLCLYALTLTVSFEMNIHFAFLINVKNINQRQQTSVSTNLGKSSIESHLKGVALLCASWLFMIHTKDKAYNHGYSLYLLN